MENEHVGSRVRALREELGLSERGLSLRAGLKSPTHVGLIEDGKRAKLQGETLIKLARALGTTPEWLLYGTGPKRTSRTKKAA